MSGEWKSLNEIKVGDKVWTPNGFAEVESVDAGTICYRDDSGDYHERSNQKEWFVQ